MNQKSLNKWEETRSKGIVNFILKDAILRFGIPVGILLVFLIDIKNRGLLILSDFEIIVSNTVLGLIYGLIIGSTYGVGMWCIKKKDARNSSL